MTSFTASITALPGKLALLASISTILISSCSDPASVGLELAPGNNQIGVFYQEFNLDAQMVLLDSFGTVNSGVLVVGNESDNLFGKTESTGYSRLFFDATVQKPEIGAILDSMFFNLQVVSVNGSNLDQAKRYSVHKLTEPILDTLYYNFDELAYEENSFASIDIVFDDERDTVIKLSIEEDFQEELFERLTLRRDNTFDNLFTFREYFPGIAVKAREGDNTTIGVGVGPNTGIAIYYHLDGDTISKRYDISSFPARSFNGIKSDRSGTPTEVITEYNKAYDVGQIVGMKSTLGMALRIDTSPLDAFLDTLSGVIFNQAIFSIGEIEEQNEDNTPISGMVIRLVDSQNKLITSTINGATLYVQEDGVPQIILDQNGNQVPNNAFSSAADLTFIPAEDQFTTGITSHMNAIFRGQIQRQDWLFYVLSTDSRVDDFKRSLRQFKVNKDKIKVQVIYSKSR